jgi:hypothetical protein
MFAPMTRFAGFALILALAACATAPPAAPTPSNEPVVAAPPTSRFAALLGWAGRPDAPVLAAIERELGAADIRRQDGAGASLTYRLESCALVLLFAADAQNEMRLAETHPGPRRSGAPAPSLDQCATEIEARAPR